MYPNEISVRLENPSKYERYTRRNGMFGEGVDVIFGVTKEGKTEIQAIRFKTSAKWNMKRVRAWLKKHPSIKPISVENAKKT